MPAPPRGPAAPSRPPAAASASPRASTGTATDSPPPSRSTASSARSDSRPARRSRPSGRAATSCAPACGRSRPGAGTGHLNHDTGRYLDQVKSTLISFADRRRELLAWLPRFGHLRTLALPAHLPALNAQLHEWRDSLAASTCNHRRHALTNLVRVLYGRRASFDLLDPRPLPPAAPRSPAGSTAATSPACSPRSSPAQSPVRAWS